VQQQLNPSGIITAYNYLTMLKKDEEKTTFSIKIDEFMRIQF
jgi:hypothetical protein